VVHLQLLGAVQVAASDGTTHGVGAPKQRSLLTALALRPGEVVARQRLIDELWPRDPPSACEATLQSHAAGVRRHLGDVALRASREGGYVLDIERSRVDAHRFEDLSAAGHAAHARGAAQDAADQLREALALWRGEALADVPDGPEARAARTRLTERYLEAVEARVAADLAWGCAGELVGELEELVVAHPLRERLWAHLMLALYRCGRQGDALACYQRASHHLREELGVDPGDQLSTLQQRILCHDPELAAPDAPTTAAAAGGPAPAVEAFHLPAPREGPVGRDDDVAELRRWLATHRLVTLTGPGGAGKTTLALHVGRQLEAEKPEGAVLIELAHVEDPRDLATVAMGALGAEDQASQPSATSVASALGDRDVLVVLDNCEHVSDAAAELVEVVVSACPAVQVLATSRQPLDVAGEQRWPVPPLAVPDEDADPAEILASPAVSLLLRRGKAADPSFTVAPQEAATAARIVCELDGLPLAIELVAVRVATMSLAEIAEHLADRFRLLRGGPRTAAARHQTLESALAWSEQLLDEGEHRTLRRLAVLPGGADRATARRVAFEGDAEDLAVADVLDALVRKSLLGVDRCGGRSRYRMLETVRAYFLDRLAAGEAEGTRHRLAQELLELSKAASAAVRGGDAEGVLSRLDDELANLAAVRSWALSGGDAGMLFEAVTHLPLVAMLRVRPVLYDVLDSAGDAVERMAPPQRPAVAAATAMARVVRCDAEGARQQVGTALAGLAVGDALRPVAWLIRVHVALMAGETDVGVDAAETAVRESRAAGDPFLETFAQSGLVLALALTGSRDAARQQLGALRQLLAGQSSPSLGAWCAYVEAEALAEDEPAQAKDQYERAIEAGRRSGADAAVDVALVGLSALEARHGAPQRALPVFADALLYALRGSRWQMCWVALLNLTEVLDRLGEHTAILEIHGAAEHSTTCSPVYGDAAPRQQTVVAHTEQALGPEAAQRARQRGAARTDPGAVRAALATITRLQAADHPGCARTVAGQTRPVGGQARAAGSAPSFLPQPHRSAWKVS
jgi:predicted ATPase/DNA-binding SARP family transcriptional activator